MTNPVKAYNVIVSTEARSVSEILALLHSDRNVRDDLFLFRNINDNLLSFEHQYNFNEKNNKGNIIKLEIVDPEGTFTTRFIGNSLKSLIQSEFSNSIENKLYDEKQEKKQFADKLVKSTIEIRDVGIYSDRINEQEIKNSLPQGLPDFQKEEIVKYFSDQFNNGFRGKVETSTLNILVQELGLSSVDSPPQPYLYFYYGENDDVNNWAGPIMAQFTQAAYNYSYETGQKSISLEFTSTHNFMGFSKLQLEELGKNMAVDPMYRLAYILRADYVGGTERQLIRTGGTSIHNILIDIIKTYIKKTTNDNVNVLVLLPNIDLYIQKVYANYASTTSLSKKDRENHLLFLRLFSEMGFEVFCSRNSFPFAVGDSDIGSEIILTHIIAPKSHYFGPGQEAMVEQFINVAAALNPGLVELLIFIGMRKDPKDSLAAPLQKIINNISNVVTSVVPKLVVIDDPIYLTKFSQHCQNQGITDIIKDDKYPLVIFGDQDLIELYFGGKIIYENKNLFQNVTNVNAPAGANQAIVNAYGQYASKKFEILSDRDKKLFNDGYVTDIAFNSFLSTKTSSNFFIAKDTFALPNALSAVNELNIPVAKLGVAESNILDIDFNFKDFLSAAVTKIRYPKAQSDNVFASVNPKDLDKLNLISKDGLQKLNQVLLNTSIAPPQRSLDITSILNSDPLFNSKVSTSKKANTITEIINFIEQLSTNNSAGFTSLTNYLKNINSALLYESLYKFLVSQQYIGVIKTLPNFSLSKPPDLLPPLLLLIKEPTLGPPYQVNQESFLNSLRGFYKIIGYKHTISNSDVCSEFFINRNIKLDYPQP